VNLVITVGCSIDCMNVLALTSILSNLSFFFKKLIYLVWCLFSTLNILKRILILAPPLKAFALSGTFLDTRLTFDFQLFCQIIYYLFVPIFLFTMLTNCMRQILIQWLILIFELVNVHLLLAYHNFQLLIFYQVSYFIIFRDYLSWEFFRTLGLFPDLVYLIYLFLHIIIKTLTIHFICSSYTIRSCDSFEDFFLKITK
jgi:hypothetical protein